MTQDSQRLTCKEVSRILSDGLDKDMAPPERARLRLHLVICEACRQVEQQMAFMREALHRLGQHDKGDKGGPDGA